MRPEPSTSCRLRRPWRPTGLLGPGLVLLLLAAAAMAQDAARRGVARTVVPAEMPLAVDPAALRRAAAEQRADVRREPSPGDEWTEQDLGIKFRWVPAGTFKMGSPESEKGRDKHEKLHSVTLTCGFWMGETEVTQGQFARFVAATGYRTEAEKDGWSYDWTGEEWAKEEGVTWRQSGGDDHPVVHVSWNDAQAFCAWASGETGVEIRLPTEAEWERAARAGTSTATYAGDLTLRGECEAPELEAIAWYCGNSGRTSHPVGGKRANDWGLEDMLGNVWEWVEDAAGWQEGVVTKTYDSDTEDPLSSAGSGRVSRGGSWSTFARDLRSAERIAGHPGSRLGYLGFRLVRGQEK